MYGTCLTSDTFHIPTPSQDASAVPRLVRPTPAPAPATLDLYRELSAISQEIESCRQNC